MSEDRNSYENIFTTAIHAGQPVPLEGAIPHVPPIHPSAGYSYQTWEEMSNALGGGRRNFIYARNGGPTQAAFEDAVAALEGAEAAIGFSSGMAALHAAILTVAHAGGHVLVAEALYGSTLTLLRWLDANMDITVHIVDMTDLEATRVLVDEVEPTAVICEIIDNPTVRVVDLPAIAMMVHAVGGQVLVDNTFATPYLLRPLEVGADLVVHSATKFLNGHGDVLGGIVAGPRDLCHVVDDNRKLMGGMMGPFDAWLALRGLRTLPLRMRESCHNALEIATWLKDQPGVSRVDYPGLLDHAQHEVAARLFREGTFGAMLAFELADGDQDKAFAFMDALNTVRRLATLGDLSTMASHPATASHRSMTPEERAHLGITDGLIRLSVGVEDAADLIADLERALQAI